MKILVTGANGQLGREMHNILETEYPGHTIYTDIEDLDLTDGAGVSRFVLRNDISHIVNCAAYTAVDRAEEEKATCYAVNVDAVKNLGLAADSVGAKIIHISTDYVFDGKNFQPYKESDKVNPLSQYGNTKRLGETALIAYMPNSIIIRTSWLYSPYGKNFVKTILKAAADNKSLKVVSDQIGTPTYARDLANAIYKILRNNQWVEGIYNFSDEGVCSWYDFAKAIVRIAKYNTCEVCPISTDDYPTTATRPFYSVLDKSKIKLTYNVAIPHWEESLTDCIGRIQAHEE
jgi:dTDP-4-dehydrorhamnose reductase